LRALDSKLVGRLLHASFGVRAYADADGERVAERSFPSAGGQYPLEVYVATQSVTGVPDGAHHYSVREHELVTRRVGLVHPQLTDIAIGQQAIASTNLVVVITAIFDRTMWRYEQRGYRHILLEAGHVGQNFCLCAPALGLGVVPIGAFYDRELNDLFGLERDEAALYMLCFGAPRNPDEAREGG
jgi:SagB-type dehydrogenase family enzyme